MSDWRKVPLGEVLNFQRGFDITRTNQEEGPIPVVSSGGVSSFNNEAAAKGPGVVIGRKGTLGKAFYLTGDYWPHDTTLWVQDFKGSHPRFVYYFMSRFDVSWLDVGSANPTLNRNHLHPAQVTWPPIADQVAIAEVLGALDDKIAANTKLASTADELAFLRYSSAVASEPLLPMSQKLHPILGGTPSRSQEDYWDGDQRWISAKDVTGAFGQLILDTEEKITTLAAENTKSKPLPKGSVIMTARGTVGAVARLGEPSSFNQSCYGFIPGEVPASILYFAVRSAADHARSMAHGSVFDTITKKTFDHLLMPDLPANETTSIEADLAPLLAVVESSARENLKLADLRDTLLPQLMSGKRRVKDAEKSVEGAV